MQLSTKTDTENSSPDQEARVYRDSRSVRGLKFGRDETTPTLKKSLLEGYGVTLYLHFGYAFVPDICASNVSRT